MVLSWVGLDTGALGSDLIQAGIGQDAILFSFEDITIAVTSAYVWTEFLPTQRGISRISNFRVRIGDIVYVQVWVGASSDSGDADISGPNCYFRILNITTGGYTTVRRSLGSVTFTGATAEWIVERPMIGGGFELAPLADYTSLIMGGAHAQLQSGKEVNFNASPFNNIRMVSEREGASDLSIASVSRLPPADAGLISVVSGTNPLLASVVQDKFIQFRWQGVS